jgi:hypothetical protein
MRDTTIINFGAAPSGQVLYNHLQMGTCRFTMKSMYHNRASYSETNVGDLRINDDDVEWFRSECDKWKASRESKQNQNLGRYLGT